MTVDPTKPRTILVIHGVQTQTNDKLDQHKQIEELVKNRMGTMPMRFNMDIYRYEDINDAAQKVFVKKYMKLGYLLSRLPIGGALLADAFDIVADVVTLRAETSTAAKVRRELREKILAIYASQSPCYVVAHSLGSIYAFDVINDLMLETDYFDRKSRKTWPVQGLVTLGSPIGLPMFSHGRQQVTELGEGNKFFRWLNYWDRTDPVVSGKIFGTHLSGFDIAEQYRTDSITQGWDIRDKQVDTGKVWLMAHVAYWDNPMVGDGLLDLIMN